jgi:hypothetical protein
MWKGYASRLWLNLSVLAEYSAVRCYALAVTKSLKATLLKSGKAWWMDRTERCLRVSVFKVAVLAAFFVGILVLGSIYYQRERDNIKAGASAQLAATADPKCNEVVARRQKHPGANQVTSHKPYSASRMFCFSALAVPCERHCEMPDWKDVLDSPQIAVLHSEGLNGQEHVNV